MFKFNFNIGENAEDPTDTVTSNNTQEVLKCYDCEEIKIDQKDNLDVYKRNCTHFVKNDFEINYVSSVNSDEIQKLCASDIMRADSNHSDLLPGIYEGGAKVWECTEDLLEYLLESTTLDYFENKSVLDLGCGVGLLGIFAFKKGANRVCFQDYNKDVIENITIPSVLINTLCFDNVKRCKFYSGDWTKFIEFTAKEEKFDLIVTSETIYNAENHKKLLDVFESKLKSDGIIFLAAKTYYFGVGGGLRQFEELISADKRFESEIVWNSLNGVSREILKIQKTRIAHT